MDNDKARESRLQRASAAVPERACQAVLLPANASKLWVEPIRLIHRAEDSWVTFHRKRNKFHRKHKNRWENLGSCTIAELSAGVPKLESLVADDSYFSLNGFNQVSARRHRVTGLPLIPRLARNVRYVTSAFVDLDCYRAGLSAEEAESRMLQMETAGTILPISLIIESGRGLWALWLVHDHDDRSRPQRAGAEALELWRRIQGAIHARLGELVADAKDVSRVTRIPGSIHTGVDRTVRFRVSTRCAAVGVPVTYSLSELADVFRPAPEGDAYAPQGRCDSVIGSAPRPRQTACQNNGHRALYESRLRQFRALCDMRGGLGEGCRNRGALILANVLGVLRWPKHEILAAMVQLGATCRPPLLRSELEGAMRSAGKYRRMRNQTIADWLLVTPEEAERLDSWPAASWHTLDEPEARDRACQRKARRRALLDLWNRMSGQLPSLRNLRRILCDEYGIRAAPNTIRKDLRELRLTPVLARRAATAPTALAQAA